MTYQQTLHYLLDQLPMYQRVGAAAYRSDLTNIIKLCNIIGNPQNNLKCIHVAGTNGKGSVTHILASVLQSNKGKVGVFVSPHYKDFRERIKVNGKLISKSFITQFVEKYKEQFKTINASFFEITTAMAFQYFKEQKVDYAVIETGMGGRLDSTNIITPILSVITNIGYDHQQFLGDTLEKIATEKAGIIKPRVPVVIGETHYETRNVFIEKAEQTESAILFADLEYDVRKVKQGIFSTYRIKKRGAPEHNYVTDLSGNFQSKNLITCLAAFDMLNKSGITVSDAAIATGILSVQKNTAFIGRWMIQQKNPIVIFDSAHNEAGIRTVIDELQYLKFETLHFVLGMVNDKDISAVLSLLPGEATYYFCKADIPRGMNATELKTKAEKFGLKGLEYNSVAEAYATSIKNAAKKDVVLVAGSVFVVAEVL